MDIETHTLQCWPGGTEYTYKGDLYGPADQRRLRKTSYNGNKPERYRKGTPAEWRAIHIETLAEIYAERDILCWDSAIVDDLLAYEFPSGSALVSSFSQDAIRNLYQDPSDWDLKRCHTYAYENGLAMPDPNPWTMDRSAIVVALTDVSIECWDEEAIEILREALIANIDDETITGIDDWRAPCRDHAQENAAEVYEWWRVSSWLCDKLHAIGEVTIDNGYGHWWGRTCTGQHYIMDGTLQQIAAQFVDREY